MPQELPTLESSQERPFGKIRKPWAATRAAIVSTPMLLFFAIWGVGQNPVLVNLKNRWDMDVPPHGIGIGYDPWPSPSSPIRQMRTLASRRGTSRAPGRRLLSVLRPAQSLTFSGLNGNPTTKPPPKKRPNKKTIKKRKPRNRMAGKHQDFGAISLGPGARRSALGARAARWAPR